MAGIVILITSISFVVLGMTFDNYQIITDAPSWAVFGAIHGAIMGVSIMAD